MSPPPWKSSVAVVGVTAGRTRIHHNVARSLSRSLAVNEHIQRTRFLPLSLELHPLYIQGHFSQDRQTDANFRTRGTYRAQGLARLILSRTHLSRAIFRKLGQAGRQPSQLQTASERVHSTKRGGRPGTPPKESPSSASEILKDYAAHKAERNRLWQAAAAAKTKGRLNPSVQQCCGVTDRSTQGHAASWPVRPSGRLIHMEAGVART